MPKWFLPTLSEIVMLSDSAWAAQEPADQSAGKARSPSRQASQQARAEREWRGAIAALSELLLQRLQGNTPNGNTPQLKIEPPQGLVLSGPMPVLSHAALTANFSAWALTASALQLPSWLPFRLLPAQEPPTSVDPQNCSDTSDSTTTPALPLLPGDPLTSEQFCFVLTPWFSLVMVLGEGILGEPIFQFSFMPEALERAWEAIRPRILLLGPHRIEHMDQLVQQFAPIAPDYQTVMQFNRLMLQHLPEPSEESRPTRATEPPSREVIPQRPAEQATTPQSVATKEEIEPLLPHAQALDVELLQAIAHEVRTPLTTIRTLTRSLLKRKDLPESVVKRLETIDRECSEQIDRFGLIFRAVELETTSAQTIPASLTRTSLTQVFQQSIPRWQQQASQRNLTLDVLLPQKMPAVVSDPTLLDKALTSLIERFTRNLPSGSHIQVEVVLAGSQLKLQLQSHPDTTNQEGFFAQGKKKTTLKSLGQMLMFQPETGSLSLNLAVTKNLFQALGGKLIVRQRPQQGEVMTVYLPLETNSFSSEIEGSSVLEV